MNSYLFFIGDVLLPIAPSRLDQHYRSSTKTTVTVEKGEYVLRNAKGLLEISFSILLPQMNTGIATNSESLEHYREILSTTTYGKKLDWITHSASWYLSRLIEYKNSSRPFQFTMVQSIQNGRLLSDLCLQCVLDSLNIHYGEKGSYILAVDISLLEYVPMELQTYDSSQIQGTTNNINTTLTNIALTKTRASTVWYNPNNVESLKTSAVSFLRNQGNAITKRVLTYSGVNTVLSFLPEPLSNGVKAAGWLAFKTALSFTCPLLGGLL